MNAPMIESIPMIDVIQALNNANIRMNLTELFVITSVSAVSCRSMNSITSCNSFRTTVNINIPYMTIEKRTHRAVSMELEFDIDIAMTSSIQATASAITAAPKVIIPGTVINNKFSLSILAKTG